ncbi:MAG: zinc ribbon domain-containing protein [Terriglobia bacterium]
MLLAICAALALGAIVYTFWVKPEPPVVSSPGEREMAFLQERKEVVYENLRDLQMEYRMGKLSDKDYQQLKEHYQEQLAGLLHGLDQLRRGGERVVRPRPAPFLRQPPGKTGASSDKESSAGPGPGECPQCGEQNPPGNRFCGTCGTRLEPRRKSSA